ncbi:reverse transcriptase-like protein [Elysia marginata]|uniref:Reverse transcriptase-like protein n=1 Tax=Elysia marginata TaxID=1093978 RepID=A0AAV4GH97_9GAST|nr:reverse transcriptase-like protein [Elysia marginata]
MDPKIVKKVILSSNPKSCVLDLIPSDMLQQHIDDLIGILTNVINASLRKGVVPSALKTAAIIPLIKKADQDPNILKNFRPVLISHLFQNFWKKIVLEQLKLNLEKDQNLIEPFQSAYKAGHCTETALLRITNDLLNVADEGMISILSLLDLSAAFDTLDHEIMLKRLSISFGLSGTVLKWFTSYLTNRQYFVIVKGNRSIHTTLEFGVPQRSVLGPVLYTMYIFPLGNVIRQHKIPFHMYADYTQLNKSDNHLKSLVLLVM